MGSSLGKRTLAPRGITSRRGTSSLRRVTISNGFSGAFTACGLAGSKETTACRTSLPFAGPLPPLARSWTWPWRSSARAGNAQSNQRARTLLTLQPPCQRGQPFVVVPLRPGGQGEDVPRVFHRQIETGDQPQAEAGVGLLPVPGEARARRQLGIAEVVVERRVAHGGRDRGEELASGDAPDERQVEAPGGLRLPARARQAGQVLVHVLAEEGEPAQVEPDVAAGLPLAVVGDRIGDVARLDARDLRAVEDVEVAAVEGAVDRRRVGQLALVPPSQHVEAVAPRLVRHAPAYPCPRLEFTVDAEVGVVGVVEDVDAAVEVPGGDRGFAARRAVVAREGVRIAQEDRVAGGAPQLQIQMGPQVDAQLGARLLEAVEGGRDQAVALEVAVVLPLELGDLAHLEIDPAARRQGGRIGLAAETDPRFIDVGLLAGGRGVAVVEVDEVELAVDGEEVPPADVGEQGDLREFEVRPGVDRLLEDGDALDRERRLEAVVLAVPVVGPDLQAEPVLPPRSLRRRLLRPGRGHAWHRTDPHHDAPSPKRSQQRHRLPSTTNTTSAGVA